VSSQDAGLKGAGVAPDFDVVVIGAGFGGLRMLYEARRRGLSARVLEAGTDVGGTWYWNRYPGARTDTEAWAYCFEFDKQLQDEWDWQERYPSQPEVLGYLRHVADRLDLRRDIVFGARVSSAVFDEERDVWTVGTESGESLVSRYLVGATGLLSVPHQPPFPGVEDFTGEWYLTARWPDAPVDFTGKRVALVGTGSTGVQLAPIIAETASRLTVLQRTANYVLPGRNHVIHDGQRQAIKAGYDKIWDRTNRNGAGMAMEPADRMFADVGPEQQRRILEAGWEDGGFGFFLKTFDDMFVSEESNAAAADLVREKIRSVVQDPATAELLCPKPDHPLGAKRPPVGHLYYETFNRDNVELVDISENAIAAVTPTGLRLEDGTEQEFDMIVFGLGFDALTGSLASIDLRGRSGLSIADRWKDGPRTHWGLTVDGFPNLFLISGPHIPFANIPRVVEPCAEWIGRAIEYANDHDATRIEPTPEAVEEFQVEVDMFYNATLFPAGVKLRSWFVGTETDGKTASPAIYFGGYPNYVAGITKEAYEGFPHYRIRVTRTDPALAGSNG
jgi:cation diffusion facilitator CzcD-associated flavoprotein CzcO